jgi:hypothetical protein
MQRKLWVRFLRGYKLRIVHIATGTTDGRPFEQMMYIEAMDFLLYEQLKAPQLALGELVTSLHYSACTQPLYPNVKQHKYPHNMQHRAKLLEF